MRLVITLGQREVTVDVTPGDDGPWRVTQEGVTTAVSIHADTPLGALMSLQRGAADAVTGSPQESLAAPRIVDLTFVRTSSEGGFLQCNGAREEVLCRDERDAFSGRGAAQDRAAMGYLLSPMPGRVVRILTEKGATVAAASPVVVVEAMKMENELCAEAVAVVEEILVSPGDAVERGAKLIKWG